MVIKSGLISMFKEKNPRFSTKFLKEEFGPYGFVNRYQWPPKSPDLHLLDFWFWNALKEKDYEGQQAPFSSIDEKTSLKVCVRRASFAEIRVTIQKTIECFNSERRKTDRA